MLVILQNMPRRGHIALSNAIIKKRFQQLTLSKEEVVASKDLEQALAQLETSEDKSGSWHMPQSSSTRYFIAL